MPVLFWTDEAIEDVWDLVLIGLPKWSIWISLLSLSQKKFLCGGGSLNTLPELVPGMAGGNIDTADTEDGSDIVDGLAGCSGHEAGGDSTVDDSSVSTVDGSSVFNQFSFKDKLSHNQLQSNINKN